MEPSRNTPPGRACRRGRPGVAGAVPIALRAHRARGFSGPRRHARGWYFLGVTALLVGLAASADAATIEVVTTTGLDIEVDSHGRELQVRGVVRDDAALGVAFRPLRLRAGSGVGGSLDVEVRTDLHGRFAWSRVVPEGQWWVEATFAGDPYQVQSSARAEREVRRAPATLLMQVPRVVPGYVEELPVVAVVQADGRPVREATVQITPGCYESSGPITTSATGVARSVLRLRPDAARANCFVAAAVAEDARFSATTAAHGVRRVGAPVLRVDARRADVGAFGAATWRFEVTLRDEFGGIEGGRLTLSVGQQAVAEGVSGPRGVAEFDVAASALGSSPATVSVAFRPDVGDVVFESDPVVVRTPPSPTAVLPWFAGVVACALGAMLFVGLLSEFRWGRVVRLPTSRPPATAGVEDEVVTAVGERGDATRVLGVVRDASSGEPLSATVCVDWPDGTSERVTAGLDGRFEVSRRAGSWLEVDVRHPGYLPHVERARPPVAARRLVVRVVSVRTAVRDVFAGLAEDLGVTAPAWWGRATTTEIRREAVGALRVLRRRPARDPVFRRELRRLVAAAASEVDDGGIPAVEALALLVDHAYFSDRPHPVAVVEFARALADEVRALRAAGVS